MQKHACRVCINDARRESEKLKAREKRSTEAGRLAQNATIRKWKASNPEKRREERRKYSEKQGKQYFPRGERQKDRQLIEQEYDKIIERNARAAFKWWFAKKTDDQVAAWYAAAGKPWLNPRLSEAERYRLQYQLDPAFSINERMRRQIKKAATNDHVSELIRGALKRNGKSNKVEFLLGYTIADLRTHIERQFTKKMTWDKFINGEIHIDHVLPKASFDLSDPEEWKTCWSLPNLRPMFAKDNLQKRDKVLTLL